MKRDMVVILETSEGMMVNTKNCPRVEGLLVGVVFVGNFRNQRGYGGKYQKSPKSRRPPSRGILVRIF